VLDQIHEINALLVLTAIRDLDVIGFVHFVEHVLSNVSWYLVSWRASHVFPLFDEGGIGVPHLHCAPMVPALFPIECSFLLVSV